MFSKNDPTISEDYVSGEITKIDGEDVDVVMNSEEEISDKLSSTNVFKKYTELAKVMFGMLKDYRSGVYSNVPWFTIAAIAFSFLYLLNPFDIIPDFIPGIGYVDDFAVFTFALRFIESDLHNYLDWKLDETEE